MLVLALWPHHRHTDTHTNDQLFWQHAIHPNHPSTRIELINQAIQQTVVVIEIFCVQHRFTIYRHCFCARREHQKDSSSTVLFTAFHLSTFYVHSYESRLIFKCQFLVFQFTFFCVHIWLNWKSDPIAICQGDNLNPLTISLFMLTSQMQHKRCECECEWQCVTHSEWMYI